MATCRSPMAISRAMCMSSKEFRIALKHFDIFFASNVLRRRSEKRPRASSINGDLPGNVV